MCRWGRIGVGVEPCIGAGAWVVHGAIGQVGPCMGGGAWVKVHGLKVEFNLIGKHGYAYWIKFVRSLVQYLLQFLVRWLVQYHHNKK